MNDIDDYRRKVDAGFYDDPKVIEAACEKLMESGDLDRPAFRPIYLDRNPTIMPPDVRAIIDYRKPIMEPADTENQPDEPGWYWPAFVLGFLSAWGWPLTILLFEILAIVALAKVFIWLFGFEPTMG